MSRASSTRMKLSLAELGPALRRFGPAAQRGMKRGMRTAAGILLRHVHAQLQSTDPVPVDRGEYRAAWRITETSNGATVRNDSPQALWIEIGRRPGPIGRVGFERLKGWVRRKGLYLDLLGATTAALRSKRAAGWTKRLGKLTREGASRADLKAARSRASARLKRDAVEQAVESVAWAIRQKITEEGYKPRHVLARAVVSAYEPMAQAIADAAFEGIKEAVVVR